MEDEAENQLTIILMVYYYMEQHVASFTDKLRRASSNVQLLSQVDQYRKLTIGVRLAFTALVVSWGIFLSEKYLKAKNKADTAAWDQINVLWLGSQPKGLLVLIFRVWLYTLMVTVGLQVLQRFRAL